MLPAHIIAQIRDREARRREVERPQPVLEMPQAPHTPQPAPEAESNRGVVIIDL